MKRIVLGFLCVVLVFAMGIPCFAEAVATESKDLGITYVNESAGVTVPVSDGKAKGQLPDGTEFSAENLPDGAFTLRIYPVQKEEEKVHQWLEDSIADELDAIIAYYVVLLDKDGKPVSNQGAKVTVTSPEAKDAISVYAIDPEGDSKSLTTTDKDGKITFTATGSSFYALCTVAKNAGTSDFLPLGFLLLGVSAGCTVALFVLIRKRKAC